MASCEHRPSGENNHPHQHEYANPSTGFAPNSFFLSALPQVVCYSKKSQCQERIPQKRCQPKKAIHLETSQTAHLLP